MTGKKRFRVFATSRIGDAAENRLRERGYDLEVFQGPERVQNWVSKNL